MDGEGDSSGEPATTVADTSADSQEWEAVTVDMELWEVLVRQCEDALAIVTLLSIQSGSEGSSQQHTITVSVARLLLSGKGGLSCSDHLHTIQSSKYMSVLFTLVLHHLR